MSHFQQIEFINRVKILYPHMFEAVRVLEFGSLDINGSVRQCFNTKDYIGVDLGEGPGVDVVCPAQDYNSPERFDVVISAECMEHNPYWVETFLNMIRLCRPGGMVIMTCAAPGRTEHGTIKSTPHDAPLIPWKDYYKNISLATLRDAIHLDAAFVSWFGGEHHPPHDLYFVGIKRGTAIYTRSLGQLTAFYCPVRFALNESIT